MITLLCQAFLFLFFFLECIHIPQYFKTLQDCCDMGANKGLAIHAAVSMEGDWKGTQHSETAGVAAVVHLKVSFPALVQATVPGMWETGPERAPEEWHGRHQFTGSKYLVLFPEPGAEHDGGLIHWFPLSWRCWAATWSNSRRWAGCLAIRNRNRRLTGSLQRVEEHKLHILWKEGQLAAIHQWVVARD